jgi:hypothetical protein
LSDIIEGGSRNLISFDEQDKEKDRFDHVHSNRANDTLHNRIAGVYKPSERAEENADDTFGSGISKERMAEALDGIIANARNAAKKCVRSNGANYDEHGHGNGEVS